MKISWVERAKEIIGDHGWQMLCEALPGKAFIIPITATPNHFLSGAIGIELANKLCHEMAGLHFQVPISAAKKALVINDLQAGISPTIIANKYYVTRRFVEKERSKLIQEHIESRQMGMF